MINIKEYKNFVFKWTGTEDQVFRYISFRGSVLGWHGLWYGL